MADRSIPWWRKLPVVHQLRQSVGLQRGMLIVGLVITGFFLLVALLAVIVALSNFFVDIIAALIDPRVRY